MHSKRFRILILVVTLLCGVGLVTSLTRRESGRALLFGAALCGGLMMLRPQRNQADLGGAAARQAAERSIPVFVFCAALVGLGVWLAAQGVYSIKRNEPGYALVGFVASVAAVALGVGGMVSIVAWILRRAGRGEWFAAPVYRAWDRIIGIYNQWR